MTNLLERLRSALADRYAIESEIGRGGMATVFLAEDLKHHRKVAIKVLHPELGVAVGGDRFAHEIEIISGLTHPHILPLHDSGEADGLLFYVMPYVEGESLRQRLEREKQLPIDEATRIAREVADAMDHAHQQGIVHRDIKPANILLEGGHAVVTDFGVARAVSEAGGERVTATGMAVGTPAYMSPEQASGGDVDERSDIYALGCVLYEMLAGEPPLTGATPQSTAAKRLTDRPTPLTAIRATIPSNLESLIEKMLATAPVDRPPTARRLVDELEDVSRHPEPGTRKWAAARWRLPAIGLAAVVVIAAIVWMQSMGNGGDLGPNSVAVLPLANNAGDDSLDWYGPVLDDMLATGLAQRLTVVGTVRLRDLIRQAGRQAKGRIPEDLAFTVATASGARSMVYGSYVKLGDDIRVDLQLIDLSSGATTGAEQVRGADPLSLVDLVSARLSSRVLGEEISPGELTPIARFTTGSLDAYREYQDGLLAQARALGSDARVHFRRAVELDSTFARAWMRLGMTALQSRDYASASEHLQRAERLSTDATEVDRLMILAGSAAADRRWVESIGYLEQLLAIDPYDKDARYYLGLINEYGGRLDDSRRVLEQVLALDPYHPGAINQLAYQAANAGDDTRADSLSLRLIELEPDQWNPYDSRAEILRMLGREREALVMDREVILRNPGYAAAYGRLQRSYLEEGDAAGARAALDPFRDTADGSVHGPLFDADTYVFEGRYLDAFEACHIAAERALSLGRDHFLDSPPGFDMLPVILQEAGMHAIAVGAYEQGEALFGALYDLEPQSLGALYGLLGLHGVQGRFEEMDRVRRAAADYLDSASDVAGRVAERNLQRADALITWYRTDDAEATVAHFDKARRSLRNKTAWSADMGILGEEILALIEAGLASDALPIIESMEQLAVAGGPRIFAHAAWYLRGRAYEALDEPEHALESYQQVIDVAGDRVQEVGLFRDTPERVARLSGDP